MPNISKYPTPNINWGKDILTNNIKAVAKKNVDLSNYLKSDAVTGGSLLKRASKNIILDSYGLDVFFEKLAEFSSKIKPVKTNVGKPMNAPVPEVRQFMDYSSGANMQKTIVQNPIQRSVNSVGNPKPIFPDKTI